MSSTNGQQQVNNQKLDFQKEFTVVNQFVTELHAVVLQLKEFTTPGGELEATLMHTRNTLFAIGDIVNMDSEKPE